jgi:iron complex transport system substrate-binding protein
MILARRQFLLSGLALMASGSTLLGTARASETRQVSDSQGTVTVPARPQRAVVFDLALLDILDALGVAVQGVPVGPKPAYLAAYDSAGYAKVGTLFEPDYEAVNALDPDLILVGNRSAAKRKDLSQIAPTLDLTFDSAALTESVIAHTELLGALFGQSDKAAVLVAGLRNQLTRVRQQAKGAGTALFLMSSGGRISTYGPGSRFSVLFDDFGLTPAMDGQAAGPHGQAVSFEFVLQADADWIFVLDRDAAVGRDGASAQALLDNALVRQSKAWQAGRVVYLDSASWYLGGGGVQSLVASLNQVRDVLQKG